MAATTRDLRRRIKSIKNTAQITKAMQMVAASKMRRAQQVALASRPYSEQMNRVLVSVRNRANPSKHPLLEEREIKKELVLIISTDKGLCGGLNTNLLKEINRFDPDKTIFVAAGRKASQYLARTRRQIAADFAQKDAPSFLDTKTISKFCIEKFLNKEVDKVTVLYSHFVNTLVQKPTIKVVLPISADELPSSETAAQKPETIRGLLDYLYDPSAEEVLGAVLPHYVHFQIYQMFLNARASEHSARMVAMKSATDNAKQIVKDLTLEYNKLRQASITTELLEIATAQMAL